MTETNSTDQFAPKPHVCKPGASLYYCPTSGRTEPDCHGGHDVCCDRPDLHQLACGHCGGTGADPEDPGDWIPEAGRHHPAGPCPECIQKGLPPRLDVRPLTVLDMPAGQPALERIRASITAREQKADEAHEAGNYRTANEHNAIAAGLRIAEAHVQLGRDAEVAMLRQRLALAATGLGGTPAAQAADQASDHPRRQAGTEVTHATECGDACTERHTYGADCAALNPDWDPTIGLRDRYLAAIREVLPEGPWAVIAHRLTDAVLAARDVELTNSRRIWREQHGQLIELYKTTRERARQDAVASRESERILQQQIDDLAREIDRLQATERRVRQLADQWFVGGPTPEHIQAGKELLAALEAPKEQS